MSERVPFGQKQLMAVLTRGWRWQWPLIIAALAVAVLMLTGSLHLRVLSVDLAPIIGAIVGAAALYLAVDQVYRVRLVKTNRVCLRRLVCRGRDRADRGEKPGIYLKFDGVRIRAVSRRMENAEAGDAFYFVFFRPDARGKYDMIVAENAVILSDELQKRVK
ncbi:MAG: hypothetical protein IJ174_08755 [Clostridia bacterium]|nr:hypothetical protein [Clostridia bacterium]